MNKIEIINELNKLNIDKDLFWVVGSSSLVLRGIIEEANDIDLAMTVDGFKEINNPTYLGDNHGVKWYKLNDAIEFCVDVKTSDKVDDMEPFNLLNLEYYYNNFLKNSDREKDKEKKELIKKFIGGVNGKY